MRAAILAFLLVLNIAVVCTSSAQQCYVYTSPDVRGDTLDLDLYIQNTSAQFVLGTSSFVIEYDPAMISSPVVVPANDGPWSSGDADYLALSSLDHPGDGYADMLVFFNGEGDLTGAAVDSTPTRIGTLRFRVLQPAMPCHTVWRGIRVTTQMTALANPGVDLAYREITDSCAYHIVKAKALLMGPYASPEMTTTLRDKGLVPQTQPYGASPWLYTGAETAANIPPDAVDWVLLELRSDSSARSTVAQQAAFVTRDGSIIAADGAHYVGFRGLDPGSYNIVVRHRNHLAVMGAQKAFLGTSGVTYDFTTGLDKYYGGDAKEVSTGVFALWAGDVTGDGVVKYNQGGNDRLPVLARLGGTSINGVVAGYYPEDVNMNGEVKYNQTGNDRLVILQVIGGTSLNAVRSTKVPN